MTVMAEAMEKERKMAAGEDHELTEKYQAKLKSIVDEDLSWINDLDTAKLVLARLSAIIISAELEDFLNSDVPGRYAFIDWQNDIASIIEGDS